MARFAPRDLPRSFQRFFPWLLLLSLLPALPSWLRRPGDLAAYLEVGDLALQGRHVYRDIHVGADYWNAWPPAFSLLCVPLALLARVHVLAARGAWIALNLSLTWAVLAMAIRLVTGRPLSFLPRRGAVALGSVAALLPLLLTLRFFLGNLEHLQVNIVMYALALGGLFLAARGSPQAGGALLGSAAGLKVMTVVFLPYLFWRRRWRFAAAATTAFLAVSFLAPLVAYGPDRTADYFRTWIAGTQRDFGSAKMNQSVYAMWDRHLGHGITPWNTEPVSALSFTRDPAVGSAAAATLAVAALACAWAFRGHVRAASPAALAEYSAVFLVGTLFGPLTWKAYLVVLLLPCALLVRLVRERALRGPARTAALAALAGCAFIALDSPGLLGARLSGSLAMLSDCTLASLLLLGVLAWLRGRGRLRP